MTQEEKDLLLKDLIARLPYGGVKIKYCGNIKILLDINFGDLFMKYCSGVLDTNPIIEEVKPYLFPLSENHEKEICKICPSYGEYSFHDDIYGRGINVEEAYEFYKYCYKNNIDFLGLIRKGLAINATGLNIY